MNYKTSPALSSLTSQTIPSSYSGSCEIPAFAPIQSGKISFEHKLPPVRSVPASAIFVEQGSLSRNVHLVKKGLVKLVHLSAKGRETTIGLRSEGWYSGTLSAVLGLPSGYSVSAVTDCDVVKMPCRDFIRCLEDNSDMLRHFMEQLCLEVASQASLHAETVSTNASDRLEHFMRERVAVRSSHGAQDPMPALKQTELAQLLSISPEHLSRLMNKKRGPTGYRNIHAKLSGLKLV